VLLDQALLLHDHELEVAEAELLGDAQLARFRARRPRPPRECRRRGAECPPVDPHDVLPL
jgi:hypothetical protein